ncbi:hypothetical protein RBG61_12535 [Paludicola sp. MB14-C6]|uniref:hypothetical protein n=1 Tax=Paludihabitans sp. MB14-C6 TaxID=3070656 RepID=UPI0027DE1F18|nr:hypothetical protein [Paludicola sp. MB14-C6]WMJ22808.1 hypothetical protein RBG61_12535 [Paludicola sp. MB14-C6]
MKKIFSMNIPDIGLSQLFLSQSKLDAIEKWFKTDLSNFDPLPVHDFEGDGTLTLTDGHSRLFIAWKNKLSQVPVYIDNDELIATVTAHKLYTKCIKICKQNKLHDISTLKNRILNDEEYQTQWLDFCEHLAMEED